MNRDRINDQSRRAYKETGARLIGHLASVARDQGEHLSERWGPKYRLKFKSLEVYVDDYGCYATCSANGEQVLSSHSTEAAMLPGEWELEAEELLGILPSYAGANI